ALASKSLMPFPVTSTMAPALAAFLPRSHPFRGAAARTIFTLFLPYRGYYLCGYQLRTSPPRARNGAQARSAPSLRLAHSLPASRCIAEGAAYGRDSPPPVASYTR